VWSIGRVAGSLSGGTASDNARHGGMLFILNFIGLLPSHYVTSK